MTISVKHEDYGAIGNGVADDSQAFLKAFNAGVLNNEVVFIPKGTYIISPDVVVVALKNGQSLQVVGDGIESVIKRKDNTTFEDWKVLIEVTTNSTNTQDAKMVSFKNLKIDSNARAQQQPPTNPYDYEHCADIQVHGLATSYINYVVAENIFATDGVADHLYISGVGSSYVRHLVVDKFIVEARSRMRSDVCITGGLETVTITNFNGKSLEFEFNEPYIGIPTKVVFSNIITDNLDITGRDQDIEFYGTNIVAQHTFLAALTGHISNSMLKFEGNDALKLSPDEGRLIEMKDFTISDSTIKVSAVAGAIVPFRVSDINSLRFKNCQFLVSTAGTSFTGALIELEPNDPLNSVEFDGCSFDPRPETAFRFNRSGKVRVANAKINNPTPFRLYSSTSLPIDVLIEGIELGDTATSSMYIEDGTGMKLKVRNFICYINNFKIANANSTWSAYSSWSVEREIRILVTLSRTLLESNSGGSSILSRGDRFVHNTSAGTYFPDEWVSVRTLLFNFASPLANIVALTPIYGTTAQRPTTCHLQPGMLYYDTTISKNITWNGSAWVV